MYVTAGLGVLAQTFHVGGAGHVHLGEIAVALLGGGPGGPDCAYPSAGMEGCNRAPQRERGSRYFLSSVRQTAHGGEGLSVAAIIGVAFDSVAEVTRPAPTSSRRSAARCLRWSGNAKCCSNGLASLRYGLPSPACFDGIQPTTGAKAAHDWRVRSCPCGRRRSFGCYYRWPPEHGRRAMTIIMTTATITTTITITILTIRGSQSRIPVTSLIGSHRRPADGADWFHRRLGYRRRLHGSAEVCSLSGRNGCRDRWRASSSSTCPLLRGNGGQPEPRGGRERRGKRASAEGCSCGPLERGIRQCRG